MSRVNRSKNLLVSQNLQKVGWNNFHNLIYQNTMKLFRTWRACQSQMKSSHCTEDRASERRASLITCCRCAVLSLLGSQLQSPVTPAGYFIADNERLPPQTHLNTSTFFLSSVSYSTGSCAGCGILEKASFSLWFSHSLESVSDAIMISGVITSVSFFFFFFFFVSRLDL